MARLTQHGLRRVLGTSALFSTAYGNVGSSSFARHAFNELWSFFAAWAQMLNYTITITIAISAFFLPHYIGGLFWPALQHGPGDVLFGIGVVALLSVIKAGNRS